LSNPIDLYSVKFWASVGVYLLLLVPLADAKARRLAFALANLSFLGLYLLSGRGLALLVGGILLASLILRVAPLRKVGTWAFGAGGFAILVLFIMHKLPWTAEDLGLTVLDQVLATVGFSYVALRFIDVARAVGDERHPPPDLASTVNYLLPFHMLAAGPLQSYDEFAAQPPVPAPLGAREVLESLERIAAGLFKKFVLAAVIKKVFLTDFRAGGAYVLLEMQLNYLWLYLDFSAYSDVAVGVGTLLGVATPENFNRPYLARNVIEYWERWHISLSQFIRRNVFIPIQLWLMRLTDGRSPLLIASIAFTVSFLLCGLWHRIDLKWLAWGALQACGLIVCNLYKHTLTKRLGRKGVAQYLTNPWIRALAIVLTFEFEAFTVLVATYPFEELSWWSSYHR
jgi:alginate O-acetyltransferase complex protein AlgI